MNAALDPGIIVILGLLAPMLISFLKTARFPVWANQLIAVAVCAVAALLSVVATDGFNALGDTTRLAGTAGVIFVLAQTAYRTYFVSTILNERLEAGLWKT